MPERIQELRALMDKAPDDGNWLYDSITMPYSPTMMRAFCAALPALMDVAEALERARHIVAAVADGVRSTERQIILEEHSKNKVLPQIDAALQRLGEPDAA